MTARAGGPDAEERVLHDIVDSAHAEERALHIVARGAAVRIDFFGKPAGLIGGVGHRDDVRRQRESGGRFKRGVSGDVVRDVHGRIIAWKGRRLNAWAVADLIKQLPAGATVGVLGKLAEQVAPTP